MEEGLARPHGPVHVLAGEGRRRGRVGEAGASHDSTVAQRFSTCHGSTPD